MRLWSLHPKYLDPQGLVALWREGLLAQTVLRGKTRGYRNHPQLERFKACADPVAAIGAYLAGVAAEADARGYRFDAGKIVSPGRHRAITVTRGQMKLEQAHLRAKLAKRNPGLAPALVKARPLRAHPLFKVAPGPFAAWERANPSPDRPQTVLKPRGAPPRSK
ncbi:MAG TPA: pyrimidine dimer DNA glycosylase/endonuclease V, partial [bacterium]|nr:pyrimidine dimer DNA glycosylase/endonuclease V [bacterium]